MSESNQISGRQIAAARALAGINQADLAAAANISIPTLRRMEASDGAASGLLNNVAAVRSALEAVGVEFTNGDHPGVRVTPLWMLHRVAERSNLDAVLRLKGRGDFWNIRATPFGLECKNQHGEVIGRVLAGRREDPVSTFDPDVHRPIPDKATPSDLHLWVSEMMVRDAQRGKAARAFGPPTGTREEN